MNTLSSFNGSSVLDGSRNVVTKIGGEDARNIIQNIRSATRRIEQGQRVALVMSAMREPRGGFNTTEQLSEVGNAIQGNLIMKALMIVEGIVDFTRKQISMNVVDSDLPSDARGQLMQALDRTVRREAQALCDHIAPGSKRNIVADGGDYVFRNKEIFSVTGWGEHLSRKLYEEASYVLGIPSAKFPGQNFAERMYRTSEEVLPEGTYVDHLRAELMQTLQETGFLAHRFTILPGHFPRFARERGYSDIGAALTAQALKDLEINPERGDTSCVFRKQYPFMYHDPRAETGSDANGVIRYLSFQEAHAHVQPGGIARNVIHPLAVEMLAEKEIPAIVSSLDEEGTGNNTLIMG